MTDLDEKLREIRLVIEDVDNYGNDLDTYLPDETIAQIKQAFADEGYVRVPEEVQETWRTYNRMAGFMSGQEWYDRLEKELIAKSDGGILDHSDIWVLEAAKRAAGLSDV